tara:strand:- start:3857 stop:4549 length:693 start_codon:yes stop_codon:yes gene_type:complete
MPHLIENIKSVEKQSFKNFEHLFILSKSNDQTDKYLKIKNKTILKFNSNNIYKCINYGIKKSNGEIIYLLHSDDEIVSKNLLKKINYAFKDNKLNFIYGDCDIVKRFNKNIIIRKWKSKKLFKKKYFEAEMPAHTTFFIRKKIFSRLLYDTKFTISSDFDFLIKLFKNYQGKYINKVFIKMRTGGKSSQLKNFYLKMQEDVKILSKKYKYNFLLVYILKLILKIKQKIIF